MTNLDTNFPRTNSARASTERIHPGGEDKQKARINTNVKNERQKDLWVAGYELRVTPAPVRTDSSGRVPVGRGYE